MWVLGKVHCLDVVYTIPPPDHLKLHAQGAGPLQVAPVVWLRFQCFNCKPELIHCHVPLDSGFLALVSSLEFSNSGNHGQDGLVACGVAVVGDCTPFPVVCHVL